MPSNTAVRPIRFLRRFSGFVYAAPLDVNINNSVRLLTASNADAAHIVCLLFAVCSLLLPHRPYNIVVWWEQLNEIHYGNASMRSLHSTYCNTMPKRSVRLLNEIYEYEYLLCEATHHSATSSSSVLFALCDARIAMLVLHDVRVCVSESLCGCV